MGVACDAQSHGWYMSRMVTGLASARSGGRAEDVREVEGVYEREEVEHQLSPSVELSRKDEDLGVPTFLIISSKSSISTPIYQ